MVSRSSAALSSAACGGLEGSAWETATEKLGCLRRAAEISKFDECVSSPSGLSSFRRHRGSSAPHLKWATPHPTTTRRSLREREATAACWSLSRQHFLCPRRSARGLLEDGGWTCAWLVVHSVNQRVFEIFVGQESSRCACRMSAASWTTIRSSPRHTVRRVLLGLPNRREYTQRSLQCIGSTRRSPDASLTAMPARVRAFSRFFGDTEDETFEVFSHASSKLPSAMSALPHAAPRQPLSSTRVGALASGVAHRRRRERPGCANS